MSLLDTIDGVFMNFAYGWAFSKPVRKVYYNITITGLSVAVALVIGVIEIVSIVVEQARHHRGPARGDRRARPQQRRLRDRRLFVLTWLVALVVWHVGRIEEKWSQNLKPVRAAYGSESATTDVLAAVELPATVHVHQDGRIHEDGHGHAGATPSVVDAVTDPARLLSRCVRADVPGPADRSLASRSVEGPA